jgi:hypothetical protein
MQHLHDLKFFLWYTKCIRLNLKNMYGKYNQNSGYTKTVRSSVSPNIIKCFFNSKFFNYDSNLIPNTNNRVITHSDSIKDFNLVEGITYKIVQDNNGDTSVRVNNSRTILSNNSNVEINSPRCYL